MSASETMDMEDVNEGAHEDQQIANVEQTGAPPTTTIHMGNLEVMRAEVC